MTYQNKVVMITGAGGFLGQAVTRYFGKASAKLALIDLHPDKIRERLAEDFDESWLLFDTDVLDSAAIQAMLAEVMHKLGSVDILINIAGGYAGGKDTIETPEETWDKMMNLNAKSVFLMSQAVAKVMVSAGQGGRIINIGAKPGLKGTTNHSAYGASKSAVLRLTETLSAELRPHQITVNALIPSMLDTALNRQAMPDADFDKWVAPESLAGIIGFLASPSARDISGALIPVYGGVG